MNRKFAYDFLKRRYRKKYRPAIHRSQTYTRRLQYPLITDTALEIDRGPLPGKILSKGTSHCQIEIKSFGTICCESRVKISRIISGDIIVGVQAFGHEAVCVFPTGFPSSSRLRSVESVVALVLNCVSIGTVPLL